jgi:hypothetical protein
MMLLKDKIQIALFTLGIIAVLLGITRMLPGSDQLPAGMMAYGTKGTFVAAIPQAAGPWLIAGGVAAFGLCILLRGK